MSSKYLFLLVIPVFFIISSCAGEKMSTEGFFDFTKEIKDAKPGDL
jgi:hypothetical protein